MYSNAENALSLAAAGRPVGIVLATAALLELRPLAVPGARIDLLDAYWGLQQVAGGAAWQPVGRRWLARLADLVRAMGQEHAALHALAGRAVEGGVHEAKVAESLAFA